VCLLDFFWFAFDFLLLLDSDGMEVMLVSPLPSFWFVEVLQFGEPADSTCTGGSAVDRAGNVFLAWVRADIELSEAVFCYD
jgi:hypothetical protein